MKKFVYFLFSLIFIANYSYSQGEVEALKYSRGELYGTARSMAMGNAFGALGGDIAGVSINPAGIAVYRSSEVVGTLGFQQNTFKIGTIDKSVNDFNSHNIGFVGYFPLRNDVMPMINFGFTYNKQKSFNNQYSAAGRDRSASWTDFITHRFGGVEVSLLGNNNGQNPFYVTNGAPWMPILAYQSFMILPTYSNNQQTGYQSILSEEDKVTNFVDANFVDVKETGYIENYEITMGTTIKNKLNLGITLNVADMSTSHASTYTEEFPSGNNEGFDIENRLHTKGAGFGVTLGVIYRPVNSLRLGLAYHSPVWYSMSDTYSAKMSYKIDSYLPKLSPQNQTEYKQIKERVVNTGVSTWDYAFQSPDKWVASIAGVFGSSLIVSLDYELTNYNGMKFSELNKKNNNLYQATNNYIENDLKPSSSVRAGLEYRITQQLSGRLGYAWLQNPYNDVFKNEQGDAMVAGTIPHYRMEGDTNYITGGVGYRLNRNFYIDMAVVYKTQKDELYPFPNILNKERTTKVVDASPYEMNNSTISGLLTLGYKF